MMGLERRVALICAAVGVVLFLAGLGMILAEGGLSQRASSVLIAGLALMIVYAIIDPSAVTELIRNRRARFGSLSVLISAVVVGLLLAVNVVASRSTQAADLTRSGQYTLSPKSALVAKQLDSDLTVTGFFRPGEGSTRQQAESLLSLYQQESRHVKVRFVDPDQAEALALSLGVKIPGSLVLQYKNRTPVVLNLAEQSESDITGAILRLESNRTPVVCWAAGDGERDLKDTNEVTGYSAMADLLNTSNYHAQDVLLIQQGVPSTCDLLVVLQLSRPLSDSSIKAVQDYLAKGGKLLLGIDPWVDGKVRDSANEVVKSYGVAFDGGLVVEPDPAHSAADDPTTPVVFSYGESPITKDLGRGYVFFPQSTGINGSAGGDAASVNLATTSDRSYSIPQQRTSLDRRSTDKAGPVVVMQSTEEPHGSGPRTRVVLVGTSGLGENRTMPPAAQGANPDLLLASLDWLSQQDSLIAIGPKPQSAAPLALTAEDLAVNVALTVLVMPLLVLLAGLLVLVRRRRVAA